MRKRWLTAAAVAAVVSMLIGPALAQEKAANRGKTSFSPVDQTEPFDAVVKRMSSAKAGVVRTQHTLLEERYDLANRATRGDHVPRQGGAGRRAGEAQEYDLGGARPADPAGHPDPRPVAEGLLSAAASQPRRRRHALSEVPHRRDQEAERARPDAVRSRLRLRTTSCRSFRRRSF